MTGDGDGRAGLPRIAVVGAGIFARTQYIPRLREIAHLVVLKAIWSRTQVCAPRPRPSADLGTEDHRMRTNSRLNHCLGAQRCKLL
jgi:hypothetical protein